MGRQTSIARSIVDPLKGDRKRPPSGLGKIVSLFSTAFSLYQLPLDKIQPQVFENLRQNCWAVKDDDYERAFQIDPDGETQGGDSLPLHAIGDMGFSGSTFYATSNQQYLVKSVPRYSEHSFFEHDLLSPYATYIAEHPHSLLVRICDFLGTPSLSIGRVLRLAPSHHIVMDNIMYGQAQAKENWESWDLKPTSYFYPERDIASGRLTSEATKNQLADEFHDKVLLTKDQADAFFTALDEDTRLLAEHNAVDYSLFLVRIKTAPKSPTEVADPSTAAAEAADVVPRAPPSVPPAPPSWRAGIPSPDGKHIFRTALLDFFWAKHKVQPRVMTALVKLWNVLISRQGPMSITTTPEEYRQRFLKMCRGIVEITESGEIEL